MVNPIALEIFGLKIYWYGIVYSLGFLLSYFYIQYFGKNLKISKEKQENIFFYFMIFSLIGGRIFEIIFYNLTYYIQNPIKIFYVWEGGMSIHGGILFGALTLYYFSKKYKTNIYKLTDLYVIPASLGLAFGRLANLINQELIGTPTNSSIGVIFSSHDNLNRHPVQIYQSIKNMFTFQILFYLKIFKKLKPGILTALFLILYNFGRFFTDFFREHTVSFGVISMGQLLCLLFGFWGIWIYLKIK